eukprot:CAMPEP_0119313382 /NCGR_PEP_ID=MMETSP1333-20130426/28886_1 /TAXON_ID=418940 /ORGANISM="Scyphosphaera apsteinii, Strain RCC1455" /LENGTH=50 /DNA_ID=CAMNT_0007318199 /DNA_START=81 /DNA_END=233 /DNA_ORIENTATION=-
MALIITSGSSDGGSSDLDFVYESPESDSELDMEYMPDADVGAWELAAARQ